MKRPIVMLLFVFLAGCGGVFAPPTLVERLRILGIKAEPPEVDMFGQTELTALIADPQGGGRDLECTWAICLFELGYVATDIPCPGPGSYNLTGDCTGAALSMPDLVAWLVEQGFPVDEFDPENSPMEELPVIAGLQVVAGGESVRGFKRISVKLKATDEEPNQNPVLEGVAVGGTEWRPGGGVDLELAADQEILLVPQADESTRQMYLRREDDVERLEDFLFSWYSTTGEFFDRLTLLKVDSHGRRLDTNKWELPDEVESSQNTLWLLVRDGRYGLDWLEVPVLILPAGSP